MRRIAPLLSLIGLVALTVSAVPASAQGPTLDRPRSGSDAVRALGDQIGAVAADHGTTGGVLRSRLHGDNALWVDTAGKLFYIDPAPQAVSNPEAPGVSTGPGTAPTALSALPAMASRPNAGRTVFLDVDGVGGTYGGAIGGAWNSRTYTGGDGIAEPYSLDADLTTFSSDEVADIVSIWQRVAEDFAPFDINVTTVDPGLNAIDRAGAGDTVYGTRVAITSSANSCGCGGVAYVGVFDHDGANGRAHGYYQPAFVYNRGAKHAAEAATHEAGHNLGLSHDGTSTEGYYTGHNGWAPIMGVGYYQPISQWSAGEYPDANNKEPDFEVVASNGGPLRADDQDDRQPTSLLPDGRKARGVIERAGDVDAYTFTAPSEPDADRSTVRMTVTIDPATISPNLDLTATLASAPDAVTSAVDSAFITADVASGLAATITADLTPAEAYTVAVRATGARTLDNGYGAYGSVGAYTVAAVPGGPATVSGPKEPTGLTGGLAAGSTTTVALGWTDASADETAFELERYTATGTVPDRVVPLAADRTGHLDSPGTGTWRYRVRAVNVGGTSPWTSEVTVTVGRGGGGKRS